MPLHTGDPLIDGFPLRTFLSDPDSGADLGRINHRVGQLVLHPDGLLHWPGRLRAPYQPFDFPEGMRRTGLSFVCCGAEPAPAGERPLFVSEGLDGATKAYTERPVPFLLADLGAESARPLGRIGATTLELLVEPPSVEAARGGYLLVLDATPESEHFACDLVHFEAGCAWPLDGLRRALWIASGEVDARPPPISWQETPAAPWQPFDPSTKGELPFERGPLKAVLVSPERVRITLNGATAEVPRYWLARMLFRIGLHDFQLGYLETYEGFFYDDRDGFCIGLRGAEPWCPGRDELESTLEALYRAVAPDGYTEELI